MNTDKSELETQGNGIIADVSGRLGKKKHKWDLDDNCSKCGLKRKARALSKNLRGYGHHLYDYKINGEWIASCPTCH